MSDTQESDRPILFFGCDMGGWQSKDEKKGDALAVSKWVGEELHHIEATAAVQFFPVDEDGPLARLVRDALNDRSKIVVAIDAALGWPREFARLVAAAPNGVPYDSRRFESAITNPYLYRETERFIKSHIRRDRDPLTAPGDKFGNNSSKAQMLAAWFRTKLPNAYRPPFSGSDREKAKSSEHTIIEVYPDASRQSQKFVDLRWPKYQPRLAEAGQKDIADAQFCSMTGVCYAMQMGIIPHVTGYPSVCCPDDDDASSERQQTIEQEGWIFAPYDPHRSKK